MRDTKVMAYEHLISKCCDNLFDLSDHHLRNSGINDFMREMIV